jgi:hypothetical protein
MLVLNVILAIYTVVSLWYIRSLHVRIRAHEDAWNQIEKLTDANKDGDIVIHVHHT